MDQYFKGFMEAALAIRRGLRALADEYGDNKAKFMDELVAVEQCMNVVDREVQWVIERAAEHCGVKES